MIRCIVPEPVRQERHEEKTRKVIVLQDWPDDETLNKINRRAPRQANILRYLHASENKREPLADLGGTAALNPCRSLEKAGYVRIEEEQVHRDPAGSEEFAPTRPLELNEEQAAALKEKIREMFAKYFVAGQTEEYISSRFDALLEQNERWGEVLRAAAASYNPQLPGSIHGGKIHA